MVAAQSLAWGKWPAAALESFLPTSQLSVRLSLDLSFVPYYDADLRPLACFGPTNRWSMQRTSAAPGLASLALAFIESLAKLATAWAHVFPNTELSSHFPFPSHKWNCQQIVQHRLKVLRSFKSGIRRCSVDLRNSPTETGQSPSWQMSIRLTCCGRQEQVKLAMDVVEKKRGQEKSENDARKDWTATWKNLKARTN